MGVRVGDDTSYIKRDRAPARSASHGGSKTRTQAIPSLDPSGTSKSGQGHLPLATRYMAIM
eukprot:961327-Prorocentrum_lima.AAC.1